MGAQASPTADAADPGASPDAADRGAGPDASGADALADAADGGEDAGADAGTCTGTPSPCATLLPGDGFGCTAVVGCSLGTLAGCYGTSPSCSSELDDLSCSEVEGCFWDTTSSSCGGVSDACFGMAEEIQCGAQAGCYWTSGSCGGASSPCSAFTASTCATQPGCWVE